MRFSQKLTTSLIVTIMLISMQSNVLADNDLDYLRPTQREVTDTFTSTGDNLFVQGTPVLNQFGSRVWSNSPFNAYSAFNEMNIFEGTITGAPTTASFTGLSTNGVGENQAMLQMANTTSEPLETNFITQYYDLGDNFLNSSNFEAPNELDNIIMDIGMSYGFRFNTTVGNPLVLEMIFERSVWVNIIVITPTNNTFNLNAFQSIRKVEHVPIVSWENGTHILILQPGTSTILNRLRFLNEYPLEEVGAVTSGEIKSIDSVTKFYNFSVDTSSDVAQQIIDFRSNVVVDYGSAGTIFIFERYSTGVFGTTGAYIGIAYGDVIIAVVAEVPYLNDRAKESDKHFDMPKGVKVTYSFWIDAYSIPMLPINTDFTAIPFDYSGTWNYYYLDTEGLALLGFNATSNTGATIFDDMGASMIASPTNNDILNNNNDNLIELSGMYVFKVMRYQTAMFSLFKPQAFTGSVDSTLNDINFFVFDDTSYTYNSFNFSLNDHTNSSADFRVDYYDMYGVRQTSDTFTLERIANNVTQYWSSTNSSLEYPANKYSVGRSYVRLSQTANRVYDSNQTIPTVSTNDDPTFVTKVNIKLENRVAKLQEQNPSSIYKETSVGVDSPFSMKVYDSNATVQLWNTLDLIRGAYLLTITIVNKPIAAMMLSNGFNDMYMNTPVVPAGLNNTIEFQFAVAQEITLGLFLAFTAVLGSNGTISIQIAPLEVLTLTAITLGYLAMFRTLSVVQNQFQRYSPFLAAAIILVPAAVFGIRKFTRR